MGTAASDRRDRACTGTFGKAIPDRPTEIPARLASRNGLVAIAMSRNFHPPRPRDKAPTAKTFATGTARPIATDIIPETAAGIADAATKAIAVLKRHAVCHVPAKSRNDAGPQERNRSPKPNPNPMTVQTPTPTDAISEMAIGRTDAETNRSAGKSTRKFRRSMPAQMSGAIRLLIAHPPRPVCGPRSPLVEIKDPGQVRLSLTQIGPQA